MVKPYDDRLKEVMQYGPPTDLQRYNADIYTPSEYVPEEEEPIFYPTMDGYFTKENTKWGPPTPSALQKFMMQRYGDDYK